MESARLSGALRTNSYMFIFVHYSGRVRTPRGQISAANAGRPDSHDVQHEWRPMRRYPQSEIPKKGLRMRAAEGLSAWDSIFVDHLLSIIAVHG
jgi:hypothetical protein